MASMFWGLKMEPGKRYSTTVDKSFHISKATLDANTVSNDQEIVSVVLEESGGGVFFLTNLRKRDLLASNLDLNFMTGDSITLFCKGQGVVHLSGYMVPDDDEISTTMLDDEAEEEEEDEEIDEEDLDESVINSLRGVMKKENAEVGMKRKQIGEKNKKSKKKKLEDMAGGDSDDSSEDNIDESTLNTFDDEEDSDMDDDDNDMEEEDESDEAEEEEDDEPPVVLQQKKQKNKQKDKLSQSPNDQPLVKKAQKQNVTPNKTPNGVQSPQQKQNAKKEESKKGQEKQNQQQQPRGETSLTGGVKIKDIRPGNGLVCKSGKSALVYYTGRLKSNGKVFDSVNQGSGFKFRVGQGEVIKGWDIGVAGMKVGGKRIITCPPQVAYGQKGSPPQIPPNSTLVFEVELRGVH